MECRQYQLISAFVFATEIVQPLYFLNIRSSTAVLSVLVAACTVCKYEPRCEKTGHWGFRPGLTQTGLRNH